MTKYIKLAFAQHDCYFAPEMIQRCIDEAAHKVLLSKLGVDELSALEKLAVLLLQSSAEYHGVSFFELADLKKGDNHEHTAS